MSPVDRSIKSTGLSAPRHETQVSPRSTLPSSAKEARLHHRDPRLQRATGVTVDTAPPPSIRLSGWEATRQTRSAPGLGIQATKILAVPKSSFIVPLGLKIL